MKVVRLLNSKYLVVPGTGQKLTDGDIVMLSRYPGMKWIVHCGWYTYNDCRYNGWYFLSIPSNVTIPVDDADLFLLTVVSTNTSQCDCGCNGPTEAPLPPNNCPRPSPSEHPPHPGLRPEQAYELDRAWISVDTLALRDRLNKRLLPNGKVVRVNQTSEGPKYFIWNQITETWDDWEFGASKNYLSKEEADKLYASKSVEANIENTVREVANTVVPAIVEEKIVDNEVVKTLQDRVTEVEGSIEEITQYQDWQELPELS